MQIISECDLFTFIFLSKLLFFLNFIKFLIQLDIHLSCLIVYIVVYWAKNKDTLQLCYHMIELACMQSLSVIVMYIIKSM